MTKQEIHQAAKEAAGKIADALLDFSQKTGMAADVYAEWQSIYSHSTQDDVQLLTRVDVTPVFNSVSA